MKNTNFIWYAPKKMQWQDREVCAFYKKCELEKKHDILQDREQLMSEKLLVAVIHYLMNYNSNLSQHKREFISSYSLF